MSDASPPGNTGSPASAPGPSAGDPASPQPGDGDDSSRLRASTLIERFVGGQHGEAIRLRDLLAILEDRAFGMLFLLLTLPNIIPLPGLSSATGIPVLLLGLQLATGARKPWLPRRLADVSIPRDGLIRVLARCHPTIERVETHLRPRLPFLCQGPGERLAGLAVALLAGVLALPIVFGNLPPAVAIVIIALGLIEKDGAMVLAGMVVGVLSIGFVAGLVLGLGEIVAVAGDRLLPGQ